MLNLKQDTCSVCNCKSYAKDMKRMKIREVSNQRLLEPHPDLIPVIPGYTNSLAQPLITDTHLTTMDNGRCVLCRLIMLCFHIEDVDQRHGSYVRFNNMLLYRKGLKCQENENINEDTVMVLCEMCKADLQKSKIPRFSAANKMWIGDVPDELTDLTIPEMRLIAMYRHNSCIIKLKAVGNDIQTAQSALKGNVITFVQHLSNIAKSLPLSINDLCNEIKIIFIGVQVTAKCVCVSVVCMLQT